MSQRMSSTPLGARITLGSWSGASATGTGPEKWTHMDNSTRVPTIGPYQDQDYRGPDVRCVGGTDQAG